MTPLVLIMLLVAMARSQETTPDYTYIPCSQDSDCWLEDCPDTWCNDDGSCGWPGYCFEEWCLPYDGSVIPDCSKYVDPITKEPYYVEHSYRKQETRSF